MKRRWLIGALLLLGATALALPLPVFLRQLGASIKPQGAAYEELSTLVSKWTFDGNALDSASTNHGTVVNAVLTNGVKGSANTAYYFDGTAYINVGLGTQLRAHTGAIGRCTMAAWIKSGPVTGDAYAIFAKYYPTALENNRDFLVALLTNGQLFVKVDQTFDSITMTNALSLLGVVPTNEWTHVVWRQQAVDYDSTNFSHIFVNGVRIHLNKSNGSGQFYIIKGTTQRPLLVGAAGDTPYYPFKGFIDNVRYYRTNLTDGQILDLYNAEKP